MLSLPKSWQEFDMNGGCSMGWVLFLDYTQIADSFARILDLGSLEWITRACCNAVCWMCQATKDKESCPNFGKVEYV